MSTQRKLLLTDETIQPLLTLESVRERLPGHDEDDVLALVEEGAIEFAWDIGLGDRRELRFLARSVEFCRATAGKRFLNWEDERALREVLGKWEKPFIPGTRLKLVFNCSSALILDLVTSGNLRVLPGTSWNRGPGNSPQITVESVRLFLKNRRVI